LKAYRTVVYKKLGYFDSCCSVGTELLIFAANHGYNIEQIGFEVRDRNGQSRFGQVFKGNYKIARAMLLTILRFF
jgi:hypothetical protein